MERILSWHLGFVVGMHACYISEQRALDSYIAGGMGVCILIYGHHSSHVSSFGAPIPL